MRDLKISSTACFSTCFCVVLSRVEDSHFMCEIFLILFYYINVHVTSKGFYHAFLPTAFQTCGWRCHKIKVLHLMCRVETDGEE